MWLKKPMPKQTDCQDLHLLYSFQPCIGKYPVRRGKEAQRIGQTHIAIVVVVQHLESRNAYADLHELLLVNPGWLLYYVQQEEKVW